MADWKYGVNSDCTAEQTNAAGFGIFFCPNPPALTVHPHIEVLEQYNPNLASDLNNWIPKGLYLDLVDATNETRPPASINDGVAGYTNQQLFNALQSDVRSMQQYRDRFLQQTGFNLHVIDLFIEYNIN